MELLKELTLIHADRQLSESVVDYLSTAVANLKTKPTAALFDKETPLVNIKQLAGIIAGVRLLSDHEVRSTLSREDIHINPNSSHKLYDLLDSITKNGKGIPKLTLDVFTALREVSPKTFDAELEKLKGLKSEKERQHLVTELEKVTSRVKEMFQKVKAISDGDEGR